MFLKITFKSNCQKYPLVKVFRGPNYSSTTFRIQIAQFGFTLTYFNYWKGQRGYWKRVTKHRSIYVVDRKYSFFKIFPHYVQGTFNPWRTPHQLVRGGLLPKPARFWKPKRFKFFKKYQLAYPMRSYTMGKVHRKLVWARRKAELNKMFRDKQALKRLRKEKERRKRRRIMRRRKRRWRPRKRLSKRGRRRYHRKYYGKRRRRRRRVRSRRRVRRKFYKRRLRKKYRRRELKQIGESQNKTSQVSDLENQDLDLEKDQKIDDSKIILKSDFAKENTPTQIKKAEQLVKQELKDRELKEIQPNSKSSPNSQNVIDPIQNLKFDKNSEIDQKNDSNLQNLKISESKVEYKPKNFKNALKPKKDNTTPKFPEERMLANMGRPRRKGRRVPQVRRRQYVKRNSPSQHPYSRYRKKRRRQRIIRNHNRRRARARRNRKIKKTIAKKTVKNLKKNIKKNLGRIKRVRNRVANRRLRRRRRRRYSSYRARRRAAARRRRLAYLKRLRRRRAAQRRRRQAYLKRRRAARRRRQKYLQRRRHQRRLRYWRRRRRQARLNRLRRRRQALYRRRRARARRRRQAYLRRRREMQRRNAIARRRSRNHNYRRRRDINRLNSIRRDDARRHARFHRNRRQREYKRRQQLYRKRLRRQRLARLHRIRQSRLRARHRIMLARTKSTIEAKKRAAQRLKRLQYWKHQRRQARSKRKHLMRQRNANIRHRSKTASWRAKLRFAKTRPYTKVHKARRPKSYYNPKGISNGKFMNYHSAGWVLLPASPKKAWVSYDVVKLLWDSGDKATICRPGKYYMCNVKND